MTFDLANSRPPSDPKVGLEDATGPGPSHVFEERHYAVAEVAAMWNLSVDSVRRIFGDEVGVVVLTNKNRQEKRAYRSLRIPQSVAARVHRKLSLSGHD